MAVYTGAGGTEALSSPFARTATARTAVRRQPSYTPILPASDAEQSALSSIKLPSFTMPAGRFTPRAMQSAQGDIRSRLGGFDAILANPTTAPGMKEALDSLRMNVDSGVNQQQREIADQVTRRGFGGFQGAGAQDMQGSAMEGVRAFSSAQAGLLAKAISEAIAGRGQLLGQLSDAIANENAIKERSAEASALDSRERAALQQRSTEAAARLTLERAMAAENARQFNITETNKSGFNRAQLDEGMFNSDRDFGLRSDIFGENAREFNANFGLDQAKFDLQKSLADQEKQRLLASSGLQQATFNEDVRRWNLAQAKANANSNLQIAAERQALQRSMAPVSRRFPTLAA